MQDHSNTVQNVIKTKSPENNVYNDNDGSPKQESKNRINALDSEQNHQREKSLTIYIVLIKRTSLLRRILNVLKSLPKTKNKPWRMTTSLKLL